MGTHDLNQIWVKSCSDTSKMQTTCKYTNTLRKRGCIHTYPCMRIDIIGMPNVYSVYRVLWLLKSCYCWLYISANPMHPMHPHTYPLAPPPYTYFLLLVCFVCIVSCMFSIYLHDRYTNREMYRTVAIEINEGQKNKCSSKHALTKTLVANVSCG